MIFKYIRFLLFHDVLLHLITILIFPILYLFRNYKSKCKFLWYFFNDLDGIYGDEYFYEKNKHLPKWIIAYKWCAWRNPMNNLYTLLSKKYIGQEIMVYSNTTCHREGVSDAMWRTIKTKDKNGIYKDKHGAYIDYDNSILGKQWYIFTVNGVKYFRYSRTIIIKIKILNIAFIHQHRCGMGGVSYETQFNFGIKKINN